MPAGKRLHLAGLVFRELTVIRRATREEYPRGHNVHPYWLCRCSCGVEKFVKAKNLVYGRVGSCNTAGHNLCGKKFGEVPSTETPGYKSWESLKARCYNPNDDGYHHYGARGIKVCDRWINSFESFITDMGPRPTSGHSIERLDVNGNYEPGNCVWLPLRQQGENTTRTVYVEIDGQRRKLIDVCREHGADRVIISGRLKMGWPVEWALVIPPKRYAKKHPQVINPPG